MKIIQEPAKYLKLLQYPRSNNCEENNYRWLKYIVHCSVPEGTLVFNSMTRELILLEQNDLENHEISAYLMKGMFLVPENNDDKELVLRVRNFINKISTKPKGLYTKYTIFTTTRCNAHCYYCFEKKWEQKDMPKIIEDAVIKYIVGNYHSNVQTTGNKPALQIDWFGGEPLLNDAIIDNLSRTLTKEGIPFKAQITTNGLLFDSAKVEKAVAIWKVTDVQITLDGTENVYNRIRRYEDTDGSAYRRVLENISLLINNGIKVAVRVHISENNYDDMVCLAQELAGLFSGNRNFRVYSALLDEKCDSYVTSYDENIRNKMAELKEKYNSLLIELGVKSINMSYVKRSIAQHRCMADSGETLTILPNGDLTKCECYTNLAFGNILSPSQINTKVLECFKERGQYYEMCDDCAFFPSCIRLKICPSDYSCCSSKKRRKEKNIKDAMLLKYNKWKGICD